MKTLSLMRAVLTEDMDLFKYKVGTNASRLKKILLPVFLFIVVGYSIAVSYTNIRDPETAHNLL